MAIKLCGRCQLPLKQVDAKFETHTWRNCLGYIETAIEKMEGIKRLIITDAAHRLDSYEPPK